MPVPRPTQLTALLTTAVLALAGAGCGTDDAAQRDAENAKEDVENSNAGEKAGEAAKDAGKEAEKAAEDVDGQ